MAETTGSNSTRLLILGMTHLDGQLKMEELGPVAGQCGFTADQVRSCLRRMVAEGLFSRIRSGRRALHQTTAAGQQLLSEQRAHIKHAYQQDIGAAQWDGDWHLVAFAVPEVRRDARDALRGRVLGLGGAGLQGGLYVSPHAWEERLRATAKDLGIEACVTFASTDSLEVAGVSEPRMIARSLWPIEPLEAHYREYLDLYREVPESLEAALRSGLTLDDAHIVPGALAMAEVWSAGASIDPLLPNELLPQPWPGREARDVLLRSRRLALALRRERGVLTLFSSFDDTLESQP